MGRSLRSDGSCYRHTVVYVDVKTNEESTVHFGPYDSTGPAKAAGTRWIGRNEFTTTFDRVQNKFVRDRRYVILERYNEVTNDWTRV